MKFAHGTAFCDIQKVFLPAPYAENTIGHGGAHILLKSLLDEIKTPFTLFFGGGSGIFMNTSMIPKRFLPTDVYLLSSWPRTKRLHVKRFFKVYLP
jgi:hypothetical protein